jgi:hypothetical protein
MQLVYHLFRKNLNHCAQKYPKDTLISNQRPIKLSKFANDYGLFL